MSSMRQERVRELLKRAIGEAIRREFNVSDVGLITVNDIKVGGDLKTAIVFVSVLGKPEQQKRALQSLEDKRVRLQDAVAKAVVLKFTPTLKFLADDSIERGNKVLAILDELEKGSAANPGQK